MDGSDHLEKVGNVVRTTLLINRQNCMRQAFQRMLDLLDSNWLAEYEEIKQAIDDTHS